MRQQLTLAFALIVGGLALWYTSTSPLQASSKPAIRVYFSPEGGAEEAILRAIRSSRKEILVAIYMFTSRPIAYALIQAHSRGVKVHVLVDSKNFRGARSQVASLKRAGIDVHPVYVRNRRGDGRTAKFHHKYMVIDRQLVITGSFNFTRAADQINHENLLLIGSRKVAKKYRQNFLSVYKKHVKKASIQ